MFKLWSVRQFLLVVPLWLAPLSLLAGDFLKQVDFREQPAHVDVVIELGVDLSYVKHFPVRRGKIVQVQLDPSKAGVDSSALKVRETLRTPSTAPVALRDVIFEGNVPGGPYLVLRFQGVSTFSLRQQDARHLVVSVRKEEATPAQTAQAGAAPRKNAEADLLMREARQALTAGQNEKAILLFTKLLEMPEHEHSINAKEYLGLARERNGQLDMAKAQYEDYLERHPKAPRASTVQQRLQTLLARLDRQPRRPRLKEAKRESQRDDNRRVDVFGRLSQVYLTEIRIDKKQETGNFDTGHYEHTRHSLLTFFSANRRVRSNVHESQLVMDLSNELDFTDPDVQTEHRVRSLYADYSSRERGWLGSFGRSRYSKGGVLGRFDGAAFGYQFRKDVALNMVVGMPVDYSHYQEVQTNKPMVGANMDLVWWDKWRGNGYVIRQMVDGIVDRFATGMDLRYIDKNKLFFMLLDYDVSYGELNMGSVSFGFRPQEETKLDFRLDQRKSPLLTTSNALRSIPNLPGGLGAVPIPDEVKADPSIKALLDLGISEEALRREAVRNTGSSTVISTSVTHNLGTERQLLAYLTASRYEEGEGSQVEETETDGAQEERPSWDLSLNTQLIVRNWYLSADTWTFGVNLAKGARSKRFSPFVNARARLDENWSADARVRLSVTDSKTADTESLTPQLRVEYRFSRDMAVEGMTGVEYSNGEGDSDFIRPFAQVSYRYSF